MRKFSVLKGYIFGLGLIFLSCDSFAFSFLTFEARSAAMGGVGVATETRNAAFYNPALLATSDETYDWYAIVPAYSESYSAPGDLDGKLNNYQASPSNATLAAMDTLTIRERENLATALAVPSTIISGSAFVNTHTFHTIKTAIVPGDPANSFLQHRTAKIREIGFSLAKPFELEFMNIGAIKFGAGLKLILVDGYADDQNVATATIDHNRINDPAQSSALNMDLGVAREIGVWKMALVVKNLFKSYHRFGTSQEVLNIDPQARAGFAFRSRRSIYEVDLDLLKVRHIGHEGESQFIAAGWEHQPIPGLSVRLGYQQSLVGEMLPTLSYGIGAEFFGYIFDLAGMTNEDEESVFVQFSMKK